METLSSMSGSKWYFWKCNYDNKSNNIRKRISVVETLKDIEKLLEQRINYAVDRFALFREGIEPHYEDSQNKYAFTWVNCRDNQAYLNYFYIFWKKRFFTYPYINGIYCSPYKISTWASDCETHEFREQLAAQSFHTHVFDISEISYETKLTRRWTISLFENQEFLLPKKERFIFNKMPAIYSTDIPEKIIKVIYEQFHFNEFQKGIILTPCTVDERDWRRQDKDNRFVYCAVKTTLKEANEILPKFALTLSCILYSKIPTIFLAFAYFMDGYLELGVYLSGALHHNSSLNRIDGNAFDMSTHVAYKVKEIVCSILSPAQEIHVHIQNFVPSWGIDFMGRDYEFPDRGRNIYSRI